MSWRDKLKKKYTDITSDIADEFYPKGESDRRGEFIRDQAVIYSKFSEELYEQFDNEIKAPTALKVVLLTETVITFFEDEKEGMFSDIAYYELIEEAEKFVKGFTGKEFIDYLEGIFGVEDDKEFRKILADYKRKLKYWQDFLHGKIEAE